MSKENHHKVIIIGSGPAGYTAAIYTARADMAPLLFEGLQPGGQLTTTNEVENFPGYPEGVMGQQMMEDLRKQAERFGTKVFPFHVSEVDLSQRPFTVKAEGKEWTADTVIISTGASARYLGLESEQKFMGRGVSACATCDGPFYRGVPVIVVGGGDSAIEEANHLTKFASKVYLVHRRDELRASKIMQKRALENPKIELVWDSVVEEVLGDATGVTGARLRNLKTDEIKELEITGFFLGIGHTPNTELFKGVIDTDEKGYIKTMPNRTATNVPGVFACGDVKDSYYRQAITAAGSGCQAALEAERWLEEQEG